MSILVGMRWRHNPLDARSTELVAVAKVDMADAQWHKRLGMNDHAPIPFAVEEARQNLPLVLVDAKWSQPLTMEDIEQNRRCVLDYAKWIPPLIAVDAKQCRPA